MDKSTYKEGQSMSDTAKWFIDHTTNLDATSLSPFQETAIEGIAITIFFLLLIMLFK